MSNFFSGTSCTYPVTHSRSIKVEVAGFLSSLHSVYYSCSLGWRSFKNGWINNPILNQLYAERELEDYNKLIVLKSIEQRPTLILTWLCDSFWLIGKSWPNASKSLNLTFSLLLPCVDPWDCHETMPWPACRTEKRSPGQENWVFPVMWTRAANHSCQAGRQQMHE